MIELKRKYIDWANTAKNLKLLRRDNIDMDESISQLELAKVFNVSESMIVNWENNKSRPQLDDLLFYSQICGLDLYDVVVFCE